MHDLSFRVFWIYGFGFRVKTYMNDGCNKACRFALVRTSGEHGTDLFR